MGRHCHWVILWWFFALLLVAGLVEFCSTGKDSAMEDSVSVDSTETKVAASTWEK